MEFLPLVLIVLAFPVIAIVALVKAVNLNERMRRLEARFGALELQLASAPAAATQPAAPAPESEPAPAAEPERPSEATTETPPKTAPAPDAIASPPVAPVDAPSFEERFGTRWTVWIGGVALALGGIFLVKYSIEAGLLGPGMRLFFGALFAAFLVGAGEWTRRKELLSGFAGLPTAHIPSILTAAGTVAAYATVYAAYGLYGFIGPAAAFVLLGAVALATLGAALLHGPALAGLGLVGAYVTPALVSTGEANFWALYLYLAVVTAAAFALARFRLWRWLAMTAVAFGVFWILPGLDGIETGRLGVAPHLFHAVAGFALAAALIVSGLFYGPTAEPGKPSPVSAIALAGYLFGALLVVLASKHDPAALAVFTLLAAATLAIAWRTDAASFAVPVAALFAVTVIARWSFAPEIAQLIAAPGAAGEAAPQPWRADLGAHLALGCAFAALFGAGGYFAQGRSPASLPPILWSAAGVAVPILILIALYWRIAGFERSIPFAGLALLLAAINAVAAETLDKRAPAPGIAAAGALHAVGAIAALALALTFALEKGWLTVALALTVPGIAWVADKRPLPMLRPLAAAMAAIVMARVGWGPTIAGDHPGTMPIFNWLLYGYGVPALAFWVAGHLMRKRGDDKPARIVDAAAILFTVLAVSLLIRHLTTGGDIFAARSSLAELGMQVCASLAIAIGLERIRVRTGSIVHNVGALLIAAWSLFAIVFGLWLVANPLFSTDPVGPGKIFNRVLLAYGIPAVLAIALALVTRGLRPNWYRVIAASTAVLLMLSYLTLEVRALYHGPVLTAGYTSNAEQYTYSVVWLAYGVALLLFGIWQRSQPARLASAAITLLTVGKVFLIDMSDLTGVHRALSFIGLGLVLVGIGWLYQRLLFPPKRTTAPEGTGAGSSQ